MTRISATLLACSLLAAIAHPAALRPLHARDKPPVEDEARQRALFSKVDSSIVCLNNLSQDIYRSRARYFSWVSDTGPTGREKHNYGIYDIDNLGRPFDCLELLEMTNSIAPHFPDIEAEAAAYVSAARKLRPLVCEASAYYDQHRYRDDALEKGKALHPRLVAAFDEFVAADQRLRLVIDPVNDARARQDLVTIERREGHTLHYHTTVLFIHAKELVDTMKGPPDIGSFNAAMTEYTSSLDAINERVTRDGSAADNSYLLANAGWFLDCARKFARRVHHDKPYTAKERQQLRLPVSDLDRPRACSPADMAARYGALIRIKNNYTSSPKLEWRPYSP
ncbi:MAG: YiiG family protein [Alphaproteobacteria bacterium]|nr:YiiG family protein [Alphaproteobacteria bacterium]